MADDLTADDLRCDSFSPARAASRARLRAAADLMDQGWRLTPPPQSGTVTELDLIVFLEWLDSTRQVTEWGDPNATHEDTARQYLAQAPPSGNVTVNADDLRAMLYGAEPASERAFASGRLAVALAEADRGR